MGFSRALYAKWFCCEFCYVLPGWQTSYISGSCDKIVQIWNAMTGEVEAELKGHANEVTSVAFSQDGSQVVSGSYDKTVQIRNTVTSKLQLMTTTTITLPDSSIVNVKEEGDFHITYPEQSTFSINGPLSISMISSG